jgi:hypothetical protein
LGASFALGNILASETMTGQEAKNQAVERGFTVNGDPQPQGFGQKVPVIFGKNCNGTLNLGRRHAELEAQVLSGATVKSIRMKDATVLALSRNLDFQNCFK